MNSDLQDTHKSNGSHHGKVSHRALNEDVLQSAVEAAKDEVLVVDASEKSRAAEHLQPKTHRMSDVNGLYQRVEDRAMRFFLLKPMKTSSMAAGAGAVLALVLEHSIKRLVRRLR
jgi:hypothetical protein